MKESRDEPPLPPDPPPGERADPPASDGGEPLSPSAVPDEHRSLSTLKKRAVRTSFWVLGGNGAIQLLRVASNLALTRLLFPEAFGLMTLVMVCTRALEMLSDLGIRPNVIQNRRGDDPEFLNTAWTIQILRGAAVWIGAVLLAWPAAAFFEQPQLSALLPVAAVGALVRGFSSTKVHTLGRHLQIGRWLVLDITSVALGMGVMILWAWTSPTVWAIVGGNLAGGFIRFLFSHLALPGPLNRFRWEPAARTEILTFGRWVFLSTLLTFAAMQADRLMFAKMIPIGLLGIYNLAALIARLPISASDKLSASVALPAYSRVKLETGRLERVFPRVHGRLIVGTGAMLAFLMAAGPLIVETLLDPRYHDAGWILQIVALGAWFRVLVSANGSGLLALGLPKHAALANAVKIVLFATLVPVSFVHWGFTGALVAVSVVEVPAYVVLASRCRKHGLGTWGIELGTTAAIIICYAAGFSVNYGVLSTAPPWTRTAIGAACLLAGWVPFAFGVFRTRERGPNREDSNLPPTA